MIKLMEILTMMNSFLRFVPTQNALRKLFTLVLLCQSDSTIQYKRHHIHNDVFFHEFLKAWLDRSYLIGSHADWPDPGSVWTKWKLCLWEVEPYHTYPKMTQLFIPKLGLGTIVHPITIQHPSDVIAMDAATQVLNDIFWSIFASFHAFTLYFYF